ncbi:response regulator transcription factor [Massilia sp. BSC265]|uniref:response regulator transcription factor n=1 Tax=Massilia sp. BSC265 TaxID=1549812 RepID=UPI0009DFDF8E|nr:response regulator transcription factor [Massilia sp. BSC265]
MQILLADKCAATRLGIRSVLEKANIGACLTDAGTRPELFQRLASENYDILVLDPMLERANNNNDLIAQARAAAPCTNVIVFAERDEIRFGEKALRDGARGFLKKNCQPDEFVQALLNVNSGRVHINQQLAEEFAISLPNKSKCLHNSLSKREAEIFSLLVCGWRIGKVADHLGLSVKTVSSHKTRILIKLRCANMSELVQYAIAQKLTAECARRFEMV